MSLHIQFDDYIDGFTRSPLAQWQHLNPWEIAARSETIVRTMLTNLPSDYVVNNDIAIHPSAQVEAGAILKGPLIIGPHCFIAAGGYLRGGCWLESEVIIGPGAELKSSFVFAGSKLAHFNFVGDSVVGKGVNLEAGSIICNYRNERANKTILVHHEGKLHATNVEKFGALLGDQVRIGANAVVAPGALLEKGYIVRRTQLCDQETC